MILFQEEDSSVVIVDQIELQSNANDQPEQFKSSNEHGHLVQQILDSQKELNIAGKTEIVSIFLLHIIINCIILTA